MAKIGQRIFALTLAALFFVTSVGFSLMVVWQINQQKKDSAATANQDEALQETCRIESVAGGSVQTAPEAFKPGSDVTQLQTTDILVGGGTEAKNGDCLQVKYQGSLASDGLIFDGNYDTEELLQFKLGDGSVISGWDQGLAGMKVGGKRRLVIPSDLGYGEAGGGDSIPPNSDLVFEVELVNIAAE